MKAKINLPNIKGFLSAHYRQALDELGFLENHIKEQAAFRLWRVKVKSPKCYEDDSCVECSCQISSKVFEDRACSANWCYGEMLDKEKWEEFKRIHPTYRKYLGQPVYETHDDQIELSSEGLNFSTILETEYEVGYDDAPGIKGTKFKIKLSKDQFSGNMTSEQVEDIARDLGFFKHTPIITIPEDANLADLMQNNPTLTKEELLYWLPEFKDK